MAEANREPFLLGKKCGNDGQHSFRTLQHYMRILNLSVFPQSYNNICNSIRRYCISNNIKTEDEMARHIEIKAATNASKAQAILQSRQQVVQPVRQQSPSPQAVHLAHAVQQQSPSPQAVHAVQQQSPSPQAVHAVQQQSPSPQAVQPVQQQSPSPQAVQPAQIPFHPPSDLDILFMNDPRELYLHTESFRNLDNYTRTIQQIGAVSRNGFIRKLTYLSEGNRYSVVLKSNVNDETDNLIYEYLVGLCINEFSRYYPCFAKSYMAGIYSNQASKQVFQNIHHIQDLQNNFNTYIQRVDTDDLNQIVKTGCRHNQHVCLFTQFLPIEMDLAHFLDNILINEHNKLYDLAIILHITYSLLSSLADYFTHYDLHTHNIVLVKIPNNQYVNIRLHLADGVTIVNYKTIYIPVLIDYGHIFANCKNLNILLNSSDEIIKTACDHDNYNPDIAERSCPNLCGNFTGYNWNPHFNRQSRTFERQIADYYFIDPTRKNITHDLKLLNYVKENLSNRNFTAIINSNYIGRTLIRDFLRTKILDLDSAYGSAQNTNVSNDRCYNVHSAFHLINEIVANPEFNANNDLLYAGKQLYRTIDIWHGPNLVRPFQVS
jgi:hypothetical protein